MRHLAPVIPLPTPLKLGHDAVRALNRLVGRAERSRDVERDAPIIFRETQRLVEIVDRSPSLEDRREAQLCLECIRRCLTFDPPLAPVVDLSARRRAGGAR